MVFENAGESSKPQEVANSASERMALDVINHLHLKNPAGLTIPEVYATNGANPDLKNILNGFEIEDPKDFMGAVRKLSNKSGGDGSITKGYLDRVEDDPRYSTQERGAARMLKESFRDYARVDPKSAANGFLGSLISDTKLEITGAGIAEMDKTANIISNARKHPEMRNSATLAETARALYGRANPYSQNDLTLQDLRKIENSPGFSEKERAAASIISANYRTFESLGPGINDGVSRRDLEVLAELPETLPAKTNDSQKDQQKSDCPKTSVTGNAVAWGVAVGVLSAATGSKNALRNGLVAATSGAAAAEIRNSQGCR